MSNNNNHNNNNKLPPNVLQHYKQIQADHTLQLKAELYYKQRKQYNTIQQWKKHYIQYKQQWKQHIIHNTKILFLQKKIAWKQWKHALESYYKQRYYTKQLTHKAIQLQLYNTIQYWLQETKQKKYLNAIQTQSQQHYSTKLLNSAFIIWFTQFKQVQQYYKQEQLLNKQYEQKLKVKLYKQWKHLTLKQHLFKQKEQIAIQYSRPIILKYYWKRKF